MQPADAAGTDEGDLHAMAAPTSDPERVRQDPATDRGRLRRWAPAAVLFDHEPALVATVRQGRQACVEIEQAGAELGEQPSPDRRAEVGQVAVPQSRQHDRVDILEVDVGDARSVGPKRRHRVATADQPMADIEAERDEVGVGLGEKAVGLFRGFDERARVGMECHPATGIVCRPGELMQEVDEPAPAVRGKPRSPVRPGPARHFRPFGRAVDGDAKHVTVAGDKQPQSFEGLVEGVGGRAVGRCRERGIDLGESELTRA